jgi:hypothetical protein
MMKNMLIWLALLMPSFVLAQSANTYIPGPPYAPSLPVTNGQCLMWSSAANAYVNQACSGGGGSGTVNSGTSGQIAGYASTGTAVSGIAVTGTGSVVQATAPTIVSPVINGAQLSGATLYADQQGGADMSQKIGTCISNLNNFSHDAGTCIANFAGTQLFSVNPFAYASVYPRTGTLEICGTDNINLQTPLVVPIGWSVKGCGDTMGSAGQATMFTAQSGYFPATYTTGTIASVAGSSQTEYPVTLSGATLTQYMQGCNFVTGSFNGTATTTLGSTTVTIASVAFGVVQVGDNYIGPGTKPGTTITALGTSTGGTGTITISPAATANETGVGINLMSPNYTYGIIHSINPGAGTLTLGYGVKSGTGAASGDTYAIYCAMVVQGDGDNALGYYFTWEISGLALNANNIPGSIGFENWYSEEGATGGNLSIWNFCNIGFDRETAYAEQAGPYWIISSAPSTSCGEPRTLAYTSRNGGTAGKLLSDSDLGSYSSAQLYNADIQSNNEALRGIHIEGPTVGIGIGFNVACAVVCAVPPNQAVSGVTLDHIDVTSFSTTVAVYKCYACSFHALMNISSGTYMLTDANTGCKDPASVGTYETSSYPNGNITNSSSTTSSCWPQYLNTSGNVSVGPPDSSTTQAADSPYLSLIGSLQTGSGTYAPDSVRCRLKEDYGVTNGYAFGQCGQTAATTGSYLGWAFDGTSMQSTQYSAAGTALPACNSSQPIPSMEATVSDATSLTGTYASGGAYMSRVICTYNGSTYSWQMLGGASAGITALTGDVTASGSGSVAATIAAGAVTLAKQANFAASSLQGNPTGGPAAPSAITLGSGLSFSGSTLVASGGGGGSPAGSSFATQYNNASSFGGTGPGTTGQVLTSTGASSAPTYQSVSGTGAAANVQVFTSSGTWTKPSGSPSNTRVIIVGGGGGGGSGQAVTLLGTAISSGAGGGSSIYVERMYATASLGSTETVTVGAGGTGGAGVSGTANGVNGGVGGNSSFGTTPWITVFGGGPSNGGAGGGADGGPGAGYNGAGGSPGAAGVGGGGNGGFPGTAATSGFAGSGGGAIGYFTAPNNNWTGASGVCGGGGGGGGVTATTAQQGGNGGAALQIAGGTAGALATVGNAGATSAAGYYCGSGGGGGGGNASGTAGAGGVGGIGAGGAGGGASATGTSGAGGAGGPGLVVVITYF